MVIDREKKRKSVINQQQHIKHKVISRAQKKTHHLSTTLFISRRFLLNILWIFHHIKLFCFFYSIKGNTQHKPEVVDIFQSISFHSFIQITNTRLHSYRSLFRKNKKVKVGNASHKNIG
jgi:hypothetical protein